MTYILVICDQFEIPKKKKAKKQFVKTINHANLQRKLMTSLTDILFILTNFTVQIVRQLSRSKFNNDINTDDKLFCGSM